MPRELLILGTASQAPTRERNHNGYLLRWDRLGLLFDPGEGTQRQLLLAGERTSSITHVLLTHEHGDHCLGLPGVLARMQLEQRSDPVHLVYPAAASRTVGMLVDLAGVRERLDLREVPVPPEGASLDLGAGSVLQVRGLDHRVPAVGYRLQEPDGVRFDPAALARHGVEGPAVGQLQRNGTVLVGDRRVALDDVSTMRRGQAVAFVMDTRPCHAATELLRGADLAVVESTFRDGEESLAEQYGHMTAGQAGRLAADAGVRTLVLSHFSQRHVGTAGFAADASRHHHDVVAAEDLMRVDVPGRGHGAAVLVLLVAVLLALITPPGPALAAVAAGEGVPDAAVARLAGPTREGTAAAVAVDGWAGASTAVLVDPRAALPAMVGAHVAARLGAPVLASNATAVPAETAEALRVLGVQEVITVAGVAGPPGMAGRGVGDGASAEDPIGLAVAAVDAVPGTQAMPVVLAGTTGVADAMAAANLAPARVLLTGRDALPGSVADAIRALDPPHVVVLGGTAVVGDAVVEAVEALGPRTVRIAGPDRIATALRAAAVRRGSVPAGPVVVAAAGGVADAVAVVPWAAARTATLVLTPHRELPPGVEGWVRDGAPGRGVVVGGTAVVGNFVDRQLEAAVGDRPAPGFRGEARALSGEEAAAMVGVSWHEGCPVGLEELVVVETAHWGMDGNVIDDGQLVVNRAVAGDVLAVLEAAFTARFPFSQVRPVRHFGGDDDASTAANNTSAFNCRVVAGTSRWSEHAYGWAVDVNPVQNPSIRGDVVEPAAGRAFLDRADVRPGMVVEGGPVLVAFDAVGWGWGGRWTSSTDLQHFSLTGR